MSFDTAFCCCDISEQWKNPHDHEQHNSDTLEKDDRHEVNSLLEKDNVNQLARLSGDKFDYRENASQHSMLNKIEQFPMKGITLRHIINDFIHKCGGWDALDKLLTTDVIEKHMKPMTKDYELSYVEMLLSNDANNDIVGNPKVFISHAWKYKFVDVVRALENHFKDNLDVIVWFDIFSINQHNASNLPSEWLRVFFRDAIKSFGHTVMVLSPWKNPIPYTRAWCVLEAFYTHTTECKFEIAMSQTEQDNFIEEAIIDPSVFNSMLGDISSKKSTSFLKEDQETIHSMIEEEVGFLKLDSLLLEQLRAWVISSTHRELDETSDEERRADLLNLLGSLHRYQGNYKDALVFFEQALVLKRSVLGSDGPKTLDSINNLGQLHTKLGNLEEARNLYEEALDKSRTALGPDHPETLLTINNLGGLHVRLGNLNMALNLYKEAFGKRRANLGPGHPDTLISLNNLGGLHHQLGNLEEARDLYEEALDKRRTSLGPHHPDTLTSMNNLAGLYRRLGNLEEARNLYEEVLDTSMTVLGPDHPDTLTSMNNLGGLHHKMGNMDEAKEFFEQTLDKRRAVLGADHPDTLASMVRLGALHRQQENYHEALSLFQESAEKLQTVLGPNHKHTKIALRWLSDVQRKLQS